MFPTPMRLYRRALVLVVAAAVITLGYAAIAQAQSPRLSGKTTVVGSLEPRNAIKLSTDFGVMKASATYLFSTEVRNSSGKKVAQWTNTSAVTKGQSVARSYTWNATDLPDGAYTFSIGISKPHWKGLIGWSDTAGSVVLGAANWQSSATANYTVDGTDPVSLDGRFVAPSNANGAYTLQMSVFNGETQVGDWSQTSTVQGTKTIDLVRSLPRPVAGTYSVQLKVSVGGSVVASNATAGSFIIGAASAPPAPTTTTTVPAAPTTTTTVQRATTTTVKPTTTTAKPVTTVPASTSTSTSNGLTDLPGWKLAMNENFNTDAAEGTFLSKYSNNFSAYPYPWKDTSGNGTYQPNILSASNGNMVIGLRTNSAGEHLVAAPQVKVNGSTDQLYGRYSVRFKADAVPGYKTAWLLWPKSDAWSDGEIDFPEGDLNGKIDAYNHYVGNPESQDAFSSGASFTDWHVATTEWSPGKVSFYMDNKLVGTSTKNVPTKAMHWVLQTETALNGSAPSSSAKGNVYIDWAAVWTYQG